MTVSFFQGWMGYGLLPSSHLQLTHFFISSWPKYPEPNSVFPDPFLCNTCTFSLPGAGFGYNLLHFCFLLRTKILSCDNTLKELIDSYLSLHGHILPYYSLLYRDWGLQLITCFAQCCMQIMDPEEADSCEGKAGWWRRELPKAT